MICGTWTWKTCGLPWIELILHINWYYYTGLGSIKLINQAEMPLEKCEDFLELSVKLLVIQTCLIPLGQTMCCVLKPNINAVSSKVS